MRNTTINEKEILRFLDKARVVLWPHEYRDAQKKELPGFLETHFTDGDWEFFDIFGGEVTDIGFEMVTYRKKMIWGANYRGGVISDLSEVSEVFAFLGQALQAPNKHELPLRGPARFEQTNGPLVYEYAVTGNLSSFFAVERILRNSIVVYERSLSGGQFGSSLYGHSINFYDQLIAK